ncbi:hypothetical protein Drorol1_Dr00027598, partial [Drosera rotundifolia]
MLLGVARLYLCEPVFDCRLISLEVWLVMFDAGLGERCGSCCSRALYCKSRRRLEWSYTRIKKVTKCPVLEVATASSGVLRLVVAKLGISWLRWIKGTGEDLVRVGLRI